MRSRINGAQQLLYDGTRWELYKVINARRRVIKRVSSRNAKRYARSAVTGHDFKASILDRAYTYARGGKGVQAPYIQQGSYWHKKAWQYKKRFRRWPNWWRDHRMVFPAQWGDEYEIDKGR
jgi:hypothetical protein